MWKRRYMWVALVLVMALSVQAAEVIFTPVKVDGPVHDPAQNTYWFGPFCECASVLDVDGDGDLDIASGRNWYEAPDWIKHADFRDGAQTNGPETDDNSEFAMDVNFDGRMDVVSSGWMFMKGAFWYENPGSNDKVWTSTRLHMAKNMEGVVHGDIDGDGDEDILCNHWSLVPGQGMTWLEHIDKAPWFVEHVIGTQGDSHGNGLGDINGDGRMDIVTPSGWYEQPPSATAPQWPFHADYRFEPAKRRGGGASHPILVHDVDEDGLNDILIGSSHAYGLAWLEQKVDSAGKRTFETHWVETEYSQVHTLALGDLNGDGKADLVTGKRLFAHHGTDHGAGEPLYAFWYDIQGGEFERHILSFNHLPHYPGLETQNPPPNYVVSVGMKLNIADMDKDGRNDVIIAGKGGLYIFYNQGPPPTDGIRAKLPPHDT
ncbi:MAG: FG-GAP repeat domain-containing protein, partial [Planctomycetota bacterium]